MNAVFGFNPVRALKTLAPHATPIECRQKAGKLKPAQA
jgi:hypothetical protein